MSEDTKQKVGMDAFKVKAKSEEGVEMELVLPDGTKTGEFLMIRGQDSVTFQKARARHNRLGMELLKKAKGKQDIDPGDLAIRQAKDHTKLVAVLVSGWSFEDEEGEPVACTLEAVVDFLEAAPQLEFQVNQFAAERAHFFKKPLTVSGNTPEEISG